MAPLFFIKFSCGLYVDHKFKSVEDAREAINDITNSDILLVEVIKDKTEDQPPAAKIAI